MRLRFTPRDNSFYELLSGLGGLLVAAATKFSEMLEQDKPERKQSAKELDKLESQADSLTYEIRKKLNQTFVTPFDRDDISELASALDDCMDYMEEAADLIVLYKLTDLPPRVSEQVEILQQCARLTEDAMPKLKTMPELEPYWEEINRLENKADKLHRKLLAEMFDTISDPIELMKLKEVVEVLEEAADAFETVANMVETIVLKES